MPISVVDICRYPVKGLSAEHLDRVTLTSGEGLAHDRRFAIAHGTTRFDPARPEWLPKTNFLMLMRNEKLAQLRTSFDPESGFLTIEHEGQEVLHAEITKPTGRGLIERYFADFLGAEARDGLKVLEAEGHMFANASPKPGSATDKYVHIVNLGSVRDLERAVGRPVDQNRFRANLYVDGAPPWQEFAWTAHIIAIGEARLRVICPTERCAATSVNPRTAERDLNLVRDAVEPPRSAPA